MRALLLAVFLFVASPAYADGVSSGSDVGRVWDYGRYKWTFGVAPFVTINLRGFSITSTTTFDREGLLQHALSGWYRRDVGDWTLSGGYDRYTFRGISQHDNVWTVRAETEIWKW